MTTAERRAEFVRECLSWVGTPYMPQMPNAVKGAGADCASFIHACAVACSIISDESIGAHSADWFCHISDDVYKKRLIRLLRYEYEPEEVMTWPTANIKAGSILLLKVAGSRWNNHGSIVSEWPKVIHAVHPEVREVNASRDPMWANRKAIVFDPFRDS